MQFRHSGYGHWIFERLSILVHCSLGRCERSFVIAAPPLAAIFLHWDNVIVKNAATQSGEFVTCIFGLLYLTVTASAQKRWSWALACAAIVLAMFANIFYFSTGRPALVTILVQSVLLAFKIRNVKMIAGLFAAAIVLGIIAWTSSPYLRARTEALRTEAQMYEKTNERTSTGERLEFGKNRLSSYGRRQ